MYRSTPTAITVGTAVMTLCLGLPLAQAKSSYDHTDGRYQSNSADGKYFTDQYGDLDALKDQEFMKRDRSAGYGNREGYRSNASNRNPRYPNDLQRADETIRVSVRQGVVALQGSVEDRTEMAAAVENAYEAGARRVNNQLRILN